MWKLWPWGIKKEVGGRREPEKILSKKKGGGVKASLNDFFALEGS